MAIAAVAGCGASAEHQVNDALAAYRASISDMNVDATVELFAPSASISHANEPPVIGRAAIGAFLKTFAGYHVAEYRLEHVSTHVTGDTAAQHGSYHQSVDAPDGKHVDIDGVFDASWKREPDGHWRITRMHTAPAAGG